MIARFHSGSVLNAKTSTYHTFSSMANKKTQQQHGTTQTHQTETELQKKEKKCAKMLPYNQNRSMLLANHALNITLS